MNPKNTDANNVANCGARLISLKAEKGILVASTSDGVRHAVFPIILDELVEVGCVRTNKEAIKILWEAIQKEEEFQKNNVINLMKLAQDNQQGKRK